MPFLSMNDLSFKTLAQGVDGKYLHSQNMSLGMVHLQQGSGVPTHMHIHEQITYVVDGTIEFTIEDEKQLLTAGMAAIIPSNTMHGAVAITDCNLIDVFYPAREEYK